MDSELVVLHEAVHNVRQAPAACRYLSAAADQAMSSQQYRRSEGDTARDGPS